MRCRSTGKDEKDTLGMSQNNASGVCGSEGDTKGNRVYHSETDRKVLAGYLAWASLGGCVGKGL